MEQGRTKMVKTSATRVRRREVGSPSTRDRGDPYYSLILQETRLAKFQGHKPTYISYGIGDCSWVKENFDPTERNTNHAQPTVNDLRFMYAVKNNVMINWPEEILKIMNSVSLSQSKLLPYSIFISRIVDYLHIDVSDTIIVEYTNKDHWLVKASFIKWYGTTWQYQEDYTTIGLDLSDDDNQGGMGDQHATTQGEPSGTASHNSAFGLDQLEAMEQRLNNRMDLHFQGLKDSYFAGMEQYEERQTAYSDNQFQELRNMIQSTAEAQNAMFCSEFQKLSVLIKGDQNIVIPVDHIDDPPPPPQP
ncbi:hypothetical protein Lal_00043360 [Lupinus albus]|nr:hypothetical protein Lal_00043360 [Lupinus albus]